MVIEQVINYLTGADLMIIGFNIYSDLKALDLGQIVLIDNKIIDVQKYFSSKFLNPLALRFITYFSLGLNIFQEGVHFSVINATITYYLFLEYYDLIMQ